MMYYYNRIITVKTQIMGIITCRPKKQTSSNNKICNSSLAEKIRGVNFVEKTQMVSPIMLVAEKAKNK